MNAPAVIENTIEVPRTNLPALTAGNRPRPIIPTDIEQVWRFATLVAKSGMAPKDMQKAETITVAIMHGLEVGLSPLMALQRIAVINGRPSIWGDGAMGLVRASGLCEFVHETIVGEGERMVAACKSKRKGEKEAIERTFSVDDAKKAGLWGKAGTWQQYPKRMLQMRARAFALRDLFADVLGGLYIAEELEGIEEEPKDVTPRPVVTGGGPKAELPPPVAVDQSAPAEGKKPLPPLATKARKQKAETDCPPSAQPEAFREWILWHLKDAKTEEQVQYLWEAHVAPSIQAEQILPPDLEDLTVVFADRRMEIANQ